MIGESENVAKNAVAEHSRRGSFRSSTPKALLKAVAMHVRLFIGPYLRRQRENNLYADAGQQRHVKCHSGLFPFLGNLSIRITVAFNNFIINTFVCKVTLTIYFLYIGVKPNFGLINPKIMKSKLLFFFIVIMSAAVVSCSDDDEVKKKGDPDLNHEGEKWAISSSSYTLIDQSTSGQTMKSGSAAAGTFYFVQGGVKGSFEMELEGYNKEDLFNYTLDEGSISIVDIEQSVGTTTNQNILVFSGEATDTEMSLSGTITKQSTSGQFVLTVSLTLVKE